MGQTFLNTVIITVKHFGNKPKSKYTLGKKRKKEKHKVNDRNRSPKFLIISGHGNTGHDYSMFRSKRREQEK